LAISKSISSTAPSGEFADPSRRKEQFCVNSLFARPLHPLHQKLVCLQIGKIAAPLFVEAPQVSRMNVNSNDRFLAPGALATLQQHRSGSAAFRLRSFLLNANHYFGGQL
jgi:hypothetical protein